MTARNARARTLMAAAAVAGLVAAGCDDPLAPEDLAGVYVLASTGDYTLPTPWVQVAGGNSVQTVAETLYLYPGRVGREVRVSGYTLNDNADTAFVRETWDFEYRLAGVDLRFLSLADPAMPEASRSVRDNRVTGTSIRSGRYVYEFRGRIPPD
jgi:hypothetical protein